MRFEQVDRLPLWADWLGPLERWRAEGMPVEERRGEFSPRQIETFLEFFGFEGMYSVFWGRPRVPVNIGLCPAFTPETLEETSDYRISRTAEGSIAKQFRDRQGTLTSTQWLEYPLKSRDDWKRFRDEHLDPHAAGRYPDESSWRQLKESWANRDHVISIDGGSFYGFVRDWFGTSNVSVMFYDDPDLIHEIMDYLADFFIKVLDRAVREVDIDFAMFWEDMCYKTGPLISPAMFREFLLPCYRKVTAFLVDHGVELSWVDCDGNIDQLIPLWLEGGVRGFYPLEVAAGMDAAALRKEYGTAVVMWGNVDKRALAAGPDAIDREIERLKPVVESGGFIPLVDHAVPDDVSYEHYLYYLSRRKQITGWE